MPSPLVDRVVQRIAERLTPVLRQAFLTAVAGLNGHLSIELLTEAVEAHRVTPAMEAELARLDLAGCVAVMQQVFTAAGTQAAATLARVVGFDVAFDAAYPTAAHWASTNGARLVTEVGDETKAAIRALVQRAELEGRTPAQIAREIRHLVGLTTRQAQAVENYRADLIAQGMAEARVARLTEKYSEHLLKYRAELIASHECHMASNAGQEQLWAQAAARGEIDSERARRVWIVSVDGRECGLCNSMGGKLAPLGEPWEGGYMTPQDSHPACRCSEGLTWLD